MMVQVAPKANECEPSEKFCAPMMLELCFLNVAPGRMDMTLAPAGLTKQTTSGETMIYLLVTYR